MSFEGLCGKESIWGWSHRLFHESDEIWCDRMKKGWQVNSQTKIVEMTHFFVCWRLIEILTFFDLLCCLVEVIIVEICTRSNNKRTQWIKSKYSGHENWLKSKLTWSKKSMTKIMWFLKDKIVDGHWSMIFKENDTDQPHVFDWEKKFWYFHVQIFRYNIVFGKVDHCLQWKILFLLK